MKRIRIAILLLLAVILLSIIYHSTFIGSMENIFTQNSPWTFTSLVLASTFLLLRTINLLLRRLGSVKVPKLIFDIINFIIIGIVALIIVSKVFHKPVTGLLAASGALGVIIGLSMQKIMADVFTGIAVNMDKTINISDWIQFEKKGLGTIIGQVAEINWRVIKIVTFENNTVMIPNNLLAIEPVVNLSKPSSITMFTVDFTIDFEVPSTRIITLLEAAVLSVPQVLDKPLPQVFIDKVTDRGVLYIIRYWINIDKNNMNMIRHLVIYNVLNHLHQSGLSLSYNKHDIYYKPMPKRQLDRHRDIIPLLQRVPLFSVLNNHEIQIIKNGLNEITLKPGKTIVKAGDRGSSMFIVVEGVLDVLVEKSNNNIIKQLKVNQLVPGNFFGEMSLLTGEPRSATVTSKTNSILYEINKKTLMMVLKNRPEISQSLSKILAERVLSNKSINIKGQGQEKLATSIFTKMREFFFGI